MNIFTPKDMAERLFFRNGEWVGQYQDYVLRSAFQPIWSKIPHEIFGYEGLIRVSRNNRAVSPHCFLGQFSDDTEITNVCGLCCNLHIRNFSLVNQSIKLFINLPPVCFIRLSNDQYNISKILERISLEGLSSHQIVMELTELEASDIHLLKNGIAAFRGTGIEFAIDDFGVAKSDEYRVRLLNPDYVKIDRSLVHGYCVAGNRNYLPHVIELMQSEGARVVLEGVESPHEHEMLRSIPYDFVQGFYYAKPLPIADILKRDFSGRLLPHQNFDLQPKSCSS